MEWLVDSITAHGWEGNTLLFKVKWNLGDETWEPVDHVDELEALNNYLTIMGVSHWRELPRPPKKTVT